MEDLTQLNLPISPQGDPAVAGTPIGDAASDPSLFEAYLTQAAVEAEGEAGVPEGGTDFSGVLAETAEIASLAEAAEMSPEIDLSKFIRESLERGAEPPVEQLPDSETLDVPEILEVLERFGDDAASEPRMESTGKAPVESPSRVSHGDSVPVGRPVPEVVSGEQTPTLSRTGAAENVEPDVDIPLEKRSSVRPQDARQANPGNDETFSAAAREISVSGPAPREAGVSLEALDLESRGVRKLAIDLDPDAAPQTARQAPTSNGPNTGSVVSKVSQPSETALRSELPSRTPVVVATRPRDVDGTYRVNSDAASEAADLLARLEARTNAPRPTEAALRLPVEELPLVRTAVDQLVTSHPVWKEVAIASRQFSPARSAAAQPSVASAETKDAGTIVQMSADVPNQSDRFQRQDAPQQVAPPQPVRPVADTTFSLEPARRVTMMLGDADAEVRVQIRDHQGEVSLRFDAPAVLRSGLEGSVHSLVESLSREQVPVSEVMFSGRFDTGTDSNHSQSGNPHSPKKHASTMGEVEDASFTTHFESSAEGSLVNLHA